MKNSSLWIVLQRMRAPFLVLIITYTISIVGLLIIDGVDEQGNVYHMSIFDAYYFITYTATTIGFGETPFAFTYAQRIWVSISIYFSTIGWLYSIGTIITILQDKLFLQELDKARFRRQIKYLKEKYLLILGYNSITSEIIKQANEHGLRAVVIEQDEEKREKLLLENFTPPVYCLRADVHNPEALELAGIKSIYCKAIISLFQNDALNLRIALTSKVLNPNITMAIKSTTKNQTENLADLGVQIIENPFEIIAEQINLAINAPHALRLIHWIYGLCNLYDPLRTLPKGKYIVCGYGRMGQSIYETLKQNHFDITFIEIDKNKVKPFNTPGNSVIHIGDGDDKTMLKSLGITECAAIIAGTDDDTTNLSILATAKKLNPSIVTIARENEMEDFSIFENSNIHTIFVPSKTLIHKTVHAIMNPLIETFIRNIGILNEEKIQILTKQLLEIDLHPQLFTFKVDEVQAPMIYEHCVNESLHLELLKTSLKNRQHKNNLIVLMRVRNKEIVFLPEWNEPLQQNDLFLFAGDNNAKEHLEYIAQNFYEFQYAFYGYEKSVLRSFGKKFS